MKKSIGNTEKVAYYSDGTNEAIEIKIFSLLNKLGGIGELKEFGNSPISGYFFINKTNQIIWDALIPGGYTLGVLEPEKQNPYDHDLPFWCVFLQSYGLMGLSSDHNPSLWLFAKFSAF